MLQGGCTVHRGCFRGVVLYMEDVSEGLYCTWWMLQRGCTVHGGCFRGVVLYKFMSNVSKSDAKNNSYCVPVSGNFIIVLLQYQISDIILNVEIKNLSHLLPRHPFPMSPWLNPVCGTFQRQMILPWV